MKKAEKLELKRSLSQISGSVFPEQWNKIVEDFPFIIIDDEDIEDDLDIVEEEAESLVEIGRKEYDNKKTELKELFREAAGMMNGVGRTSIEATVGARKGKETGLWFSSADDVYVIQHGYDMSMCFPKGEAQQEYLLSLGYKKLSDLLRNNNQ
jgi:hypothetical protein